MTDAKRSPCPIACALDLFGDRWTLLIIRDLACGKTHYRDFCQSPERIATNILADRLERLVSAGLAEKYPSPEQPGREAYRLTKKGKSLRPVMNAIADWALKNIEGTAARMTPKFD